MKKEIAIFLSFILLIAAFTYPLATNINSYVPGFSSTDEVYALINYSWLNKYSWQHQLPLNRSFMLAYPSGINLYTPGFVPFFWIGIIYLLSIATSPAITYNIQVLTNLFLSAAFTYLLILFLSKKRFSAFLGSLIFAFCPYQFSRIWQHLGLTFNQWIPLCLLAALLLKYRKSKKYAFLFLASLLLLFSFDYSIIYFSLVGLATLLFYSILFNWKKKFSEGRGMFREDLRYLKKIVLLGAVSFLILLPQIMPIIKNRLGFSVKTDPSPFNLFHRQFNDLFSQAARPLSYFLPSISHPVFGSFTENFIGSSLYGKSLTEHALYLGWTPLFLAFFALRSWRKRRKSWGPEYQGTEENFYIGFSLLLLITAWLFSQPPWWKIGPVKIFMPSFFMYKLLPMYRAYCRFGILVMLAVAMLAGFGSKFILEKLKRKRDRILAASLFTFAVLFEFWNWPPYKVIDISAAPSAYDWLKAQPEELVVAEYPLDDDSPNEMYKYYQTKHEKKLINGSTPGTYANQVAKTLKKLSLPETAEKLKTMGVKYAIVHRDDYGITGLIEQLEELNKIPLNPRLKLVTSFPEEACPRSDIMCVRKSGPIDVYEIIP
ncbi:MAG: hypothetical protein PHE18_02205 [Candidatus Omnitrophica bacterium]|nr:hypothetical protein [Candidatus Omnitrophota bacterium]MDD5552665.1 hypothetical protein [Candidatus Omnitrophota bacterium]